MSASFATFITITTLCVVATACAQREQPTYPKRKATKGTAVLPNTPELYPKLAPVHYEDGTWSVHGVLETRDRLPKEGVRVKGYVAALHTCAEGKERCNPAPFVQLTDAANLQGRRLLVGGAIDPTRDKLKPGAIATLRGKFATRSADGLYFAPGGLLLFMKPNVQGESNAAEPEQKAKK